jgi:enterochelin esterase-like enzyme
MSAIEEVIVIGIHPNDRIKEYTSPGYADYGRFLAETLKPLIDARYRTLAGPANTAVMGSSLGGVVSFYLGWQWPKGTETRASSAMGRLQPSMRCEVALR